MANRKTQRIKNDRQLEQMLIEEYGFGGWLKKNAGTIGSVVGGIGGAFLGVPQLGAALGGSVGGAVQNDAMQDEAATAQAEAQQNARTAAKAANLKQSAGLGEPTPTFARGGYTGTYAELENKEIYRKPNGNIEKVKGKTHAQGGELMYLPSQTEILGKMTATDKKTYKELGDRLYKAQKRYKQVLNNNPTSLAASTARMMLDKVQGEYNALMDSQEAKRAGKFKYGGKTKKYQDGGGINQEARNRAITGEAIPWTDEQGNPINIGTHPALAGNTSTSNVANSNPYSFTTPLDTIAAKMNTGFELPQIPNYNLNQYQNQPRTARTPIKPLQKINPLGTEAAGFSQFGTNPYPELSGMNVDFSNTLNEPDTLGNIPLEDPMLAGMNADFSGVLNEEDTIGNIALAKMPSRYKRFMSKYGDGISKGLGNAGIYAPVAYNLIQGLHKPEVEDKVTNPYASSARSAMRNRRYDPSAELERNRVNQRIYNRNLRQAAPSQAQLLGGLGAGSAAKMRADQEVLSRKQNVDNQYLGEQARLDAQLGESQAGRNFQTQQFNSANRAARRNYIGTGLSQLQQGIQTSRLRQSMEQRDRERLNLLPDITPNYIYNPGRRFSFNTTGRAS